MNKKTFVEVLEYLEADGIIDSFEFYKNDNSIDVWTVDGLDKAKYIFDENNKLINPRIQKLQDQKKELENKIKEIENQIKLLTK